MIDRRAATNMRLANRQVTRLREAAATNAFVRHLVLDAKVVVHPATHDLLSEAAQRAAQAQAARLCAVERFPIIDVVPDDARVANLVARWAATRTGSHLVSIGRIVSIESAGQDFVYPEFPLLQIQSLAPLCDDPTGWLSLRVGALYAFVPSCEAGVRVAVYGGDSAADDEYWEILAWGPAAEGLLT